MPQLNNISNVQDIPRASSDAENSANQANSDSKPEFELEPKSRKSDQPDPQSAPQQSSLSPQDELVEVNELVTQQAMLLDSIQTTEAVDRYSAMELPPESQEIGVANLSASVAETAAAKTTVRPEEIVEPPKPLVAKTMVQVATKAAGTDVGNPTTSAQSGAATSPWTESLDHVSTQSSSENSSLTQGNASSVPLASSPQTTEVDAQLPPQSPTVVKEATQTVADGLVQQAELTENGSSRKLVVQLHPAELGQVMLQVDWENDRLKAKILTNEAAATELLNQNKQQLVTALAENGLNFDSLDVAYQDAHHEQPENQDGQPFASGTEGERSEVALSGLPKSNTETTMVDIVV